MTRAEPTRVPSTVPRVTMAPEPKPLVEVRIAAGR